MRPAPRSSTAGWTLIEVVIAATLVVGVCTKAAFVMNAALGLASDETASMHYEDQARRVMERISLAVMGSDRGTLFPELEELHSTSIKYKFSLGLEDGEIVWSAPEEISLAAGAGGESLVQWRENPDAAEERKVVWTSLVSPLLEGETVNGVDDNGNGLIDEDGLSFVLDGNRVVIRLTLRRPEVNARTVQETVESIVYCRN
jgi:type II secretory pathway pseudopilin PulG